MPTAILSFATRRCPPVIALHHGECPHPEIGRFLDGATELARRLSGVRLRPAPVRAEVRA